MSLSHRARRRARKRTKVPIAGGGYTSPARAHHYVVIGQARLNERGELDFHAAAIAISDRTRDALYGRSFHWYPAYSAGTKVLKGRASKALDR